MGSLVGLTYHLFRVKIITLLTEKRVHPDFFVPEINEVNIYQFDPSDLPALSETKSDDQVWYFFIEPYYKYANSKRAHRATGGGSWKITGKVRDVKDEGRMIGKKRTLVFCRRGSTSKGVNTDWVMHEFYVEDSPHYEKNFVVCYIEKKKKNKSSVSTPDDGQLSQSLSSDYESHVTENPPSEVESRQPMSQHLFSDSRKHIAENSFLEVESPPLSSNNLVSDSINQCPETSSVVEPQLLSSDELDYYLRNHFLESTYSMVYPQPPAEFDTISGCDWLNHSLVSALQCEINPDQGFNSSYSDGISNDCNVASYQLTGGLEDVVNSQRNVENCYPCEVDVLTQSDIQAMIEELS